MIDINVKITGAKRAKKAFSKMSKNVSDMKPVFEKFLSWYNNDYAPATWDTKGKAQGQKWAKYTPAYAKKKKRKTANMIVTGTLYNAMKGKSGWFQKIMKKTFSFGILDSIPYAAAHQYGNKKNNIPKREYAFNRSGDLQPRAWFVLLNLLEDHISEGVDE